jgi:phage shock protein PspC (stress-responsive transcriptional regulator)
MNKLYRSDSDKIIGGVCGGLGEYMHVDPLILRILFVILAMVNGLGLIAYLIMWVLVPAAHVAGSSQEEIMRHNVEEIGVRARELGTEARQALGGKWGNAKLSGNHMLIAGAVLVGIGLLVLLSNFGLLWWFDFGKLWPLVLIAIGGVILLNNLKEKR